MTAPHASSPLEEGSREEAPLLELRGYTFQYRAQAEPTLHDIDLTMLPSDAPSPAFLAIHVAPPAQPPEDCVAQGPS